MIKRIVVGFIMLVAIIALLFFLPEHVFKFVFLLLVCLAAWEWSGLVVPSVMWMQALMIALVVGAIALISLVHPSTLLFLGLIVYLWLWCSIVMYQKRRPALLCQYSIVRFVTALLILPIFFLAVTVVYSYGDHHPVWLFYAIAVGCWGDICAYFIGNFLGKSSASLCSQVSPKKTVIGFWGGSALAIMLSYLLIWVLPLQPSSALNLLIITAMAVFIGHFGDLSISLFKRLAKVKDSSHLIPGHGGILDRLDSVMPVVIFFAVAINAGYI